METGKNQQESYEAQMLGCWEGLLERCREGEWREGAMLSKSIWEVDSVFEYEEKEVSGKKELLIGSEDLIVSLLKYLENWQDLKAPKDNVVFIIQTLNELVCIEDEDELVARQRLYNDLQTPKIILHLITVEDRVDCDYVHTLLTFLARLLLNGNVEV